MDDDPKKLWLDPPQWQWVVNTLTRIDRNLMRLLGETQQMEIKMSAVDDAVSALTTQVQANTNAEASAVSLIQELAGLIQEHVDNPTVLTELAAKLKASAEALAAAVAANTPTAPEPAA